MEKIAAPQAPVARASGSGSSVIYLDLLRIVAVVAVVFAHVSSPYALMRMPTVTPENWRVGLAFFYASLLGVPLFLMISGALVLNPESRETIGQFYRRRLPRVLVPLVLWKVIYYFLLVYPKDFNVKAIAQFIVMTNYTFWFMYMITCVYLAAPFLSRMIKAGGSSVIIAYVGISFVTYTLTMWLKYHPSVKISFLTFNNFFTNYLSYFLLGYLLRHHGKSLGSRRAAWLFAVAVAASIGLTVAWTVWTSPSGRGYSSALLDIQLPNTALAAVGLFIVARNLFPEGCGSPGQQRALRVISSAGLGIYMLHILLLIRLDPFLKSLWPGIVEHPGVYIPIAAVLAYLASLLIIVPLRKLPLTRHLS